MTIAFVVQHAMMNKLTMYSQDCMLIKLTELLLLLFLLQ